MPLTPRAVWRAFPWNPDAAPGAPFSPGYVAPYQGNGRFDLPSEPEAVLYLAEDPVHAIAERIQDLRNREIAPDDLTDGGYPYAVVGVTLPEAIFPRIADLCDPAEIVRLDAPPDVVAARTRRTTQALSRGLRDGGWAGLRWWSAFWGEWHSIALFRDRLPAPPEFAEPRVADFDHPALREAARHLGIRLRPAG